MNYLYTNLFRRTSAISFFIIHATMLDSTKLITSPTVNCYVEPSNTFPVETLSDFDILYKKCSGIANIQAFTYTYHRLIFLIAICYLFIHYFVSICCCTISASTIFSPVLYLSCSSLASLKPLLITQSISQVLHLSSSSLVTLPSR